MFKVELALVPVALLALAVTVYTPAVVGVPVMAPVEALTDRPGGRPETLKLKGELEAVSEKLKAEPTVALAEVALVMVGTEPTESERFVVALVPLLLVAFRATV
jgi:hypothetical protein